MRDGPKIICTCGETMAPDCIGGQYQKTWIDKCSKCNTEWVLSSEKDEDEETGK
jgi:hypothetical protein